MNHAITAEVYSAQLSRLNEELKKKRTALVNRKGVILQHDNTRPHVVKATLEKLKEFKCEALMHPAYFPDLAFSDFHLYGKRFGFLEPLKMHWVHFKLQAHRVLFKWNLSTCNSLGKSHRQGCTIYRRQNALCCKYFL